MRKVHIPDTNAAIDYPFDNQTVEEVRGALVAAGYPQVQNANAVVDRDGSIRFSRPTGGEKG